MITIKEIAAMAEVSPTTVSNVIHGKVSKVSKEKADRVRKILDENDFAPNLAASMLAHNSSHIVGIVLNYDSRDGSPALQDPYASAVVGAVEEELQRSGYYAMLYSSVEFDRWLKLSATWNMAGLIVLGVSREKAGLLRSRTKVPVVFIDSYMSDSKERGVPFYEEKNTEHKDGIFPFYNVGLEDYEGSFAMTEFLIGMGHSKIAFAADRDEPRSVDFYRHKGFVDCLESHSIDASDSYIYIGRTRQERNERIEAAVKSTEYTALFFSSDYYASEACHHLVSLGIKVPEDISIAGFDDNDFSVLCNPCLTTVHQDVIEKGRKAAELLCNIIQGSEKEGKNIRLKTRLVIRKSVKHM